MKKTLIFLLVTGLPLLAMAQQKPQYSQYVINNFLLNPAISGIEDYTDIKLGGRNQWQGMEGAPATYYISAHTRLLKGGAGGSLESRNSQPQSFAKYREPRSIYRKQSYKPFHGVGALVLHDRIGPFQRTEANVSYAYHVPLNEDVRLSGGLSVGATQSKVAGSSLHFADPDMVAGNDRSTWRPNLAAGLWLYSKQFYLGVSGGELLGNTVAFEADGGEAGESRNHFFMTAAHKFNVTDRFALVPSVMVKLLHPVPVSVDYNLRALYHNRVWMGASYRQQDSFAVMGGVTVSSAFDVGYSYDSGLNSLKGISHEVILGLRLYKSPVPSTSNALW